MRTSQTLSAIAPALLKAQKQITFAAKDATNPHFKSKYADLESVIDAVKKPLNENGIIFIQSFSPSDTGKLNLTTRLIHESGEWIEDELTMPLQKNDAQGYGSAATYSRRYALAAITGLYQADDDGTEAVKSQPIIYLTVDQITAISDAAKESGIAIEAICKTAKVKKISDIESARFAKLLTWVKSQKGKSE
jgi:hypothetical protein